MTPLGSDFCQVALPLDTTEIAALGEGLGVEDC